MSAARVVRWGVRWHSKNRLDGERKFLLFDNCLPLLFRTRREARSYIHQRYGYLKSRTDLRDEPHGWRLPAAVPVRVEMIELAQARGEQ